MIVKMNTVRLKLAISRTNKSMANRRALHTKLARRMRNYIHETIRMQGRHSKWKGLSEWTKFRTGKRKALLGLIPYIQDRATSRSASVVFANPPGRWNLKMHHTGYRSKAVKNKFMAVPGARGAKSRMFKARKATRTPSRKFIPTRGEINKVSLPTVQAWVKKETNRTWR